MKSGMKIGISLCLGVLMCLNAGCTYGKEVCCGRAGINVQ